MAVNGNIVIGPLAVSTCQDCCATFLAVNNCCVVTDGAVSETANKTSGPQSNATVCGCCGSSDSSRNFIGSSNSMRSPFFHVRRSMANCPAAIDGDSRLSLTEMLASAAHSGILK